MTETTARRKYEFTTREQMRDLGEAAVALQGWLRRNLPDAADLEVLECKQPSAAGVANETLMLQTRRTVGGQPQTQRLVVRVDADEHLFMGMDVAVHYQLYQTVGAAGVPAPKMVGFEGDRALLGQRFFVMDHVYGRVPPDRPNFNEAGWVKDEMSPAQRARLSHNFVRLIAQMNAIDPAQFPYLQRPELGSSGLEQEMNHWFRYAKWAGADELPLVQAATRWLREHFPKEPYTEFSWGDARMQNVMFDDDQNVVAVFDWDMVSLAGPESDLAWHAVSEQGHTASAGKPRLPGISNPQQVVDAWQEITGRQVRDWDWHLVFASFRSGVILSRLARMHQAKGMLSPDAEYLLDNSGGMQWLAQLLDLPPAGPITRPFVGLDK